MKLFILSIALSTLSFSYSQESKIGKEGDNLDLYATLELFKNANTVEDFENELNKEKNEVNNLDLNDDGFVDYIKVIDYSEDNIHTLTLQVPTSETESQDVAVIELEKTGDEIVSAQIVGDEDLYGANYIVEEKTNSSTKTHNAYHWKAVNHIYGPRYVTWISPWKFNRHPKWFTPWKPISWSKYNARVQHHHSKHVRVSRLRSQRAHTHYRKHRVHHKSTQHKTVAKKKGVKRHKKRHH